MYTQQDARYLGKPFVLEEFGKIVNDEDGKDVRDEYFKAAYDVAESYALDADDGIVQGTVRPLASKPGIREHAKEVCMLKWGAGGLRDGAALLALV